MTARNPLRGLRPAAPRDELRDRVLRAASIRASQPLAGEDLSSESRSWRIALATTFALHLLVSWIGRQSASNLADHLGVPRIQPQNPIRISSPIEFEP